MDWQARLGRLIAETDAHLRSSKLASPKDGWKAPLLPAKKAPGAASYTLLRQGVSPGDPHLIAPAVSGAGSYGGGRGTENASFAHDLEDLIPASRPLAPLAPAAAAENGRGDRLRQELAAMSEQLRVAAAGWQGVAAAVSGVESKAAAQAGQLAGLSTGVAELKASQGRLQQAAAQQRTELEGQLATLTGRLEAMADQHAGMMAAGGNGPASIALQEAALAPLAARLRQTEAALAALQARVDRAAASPPAAPPAVTAPELAALQGQVAALEGQQGSLARQQEAQQSEIGRLAQRLQVEADARAAAAQQAQQAQQQAQQQQGAQVAELRAAQAAQEGSCQQLAARLDQLAGEFARTVARVEERAQLQQQQQQGQQVSAAAAAAVAAGVSREEFAELAGRVQEEASAIEDLQGKVGQLSGLQAAVDDANQRLFELRVEVQNAAEDGAITTASIRRQAEAAEQKAEEAADAVSFVHQLAGNLQAELERVGLQVAALQESTGASSAGAAGAEVPAAAAVAAMVRQQVAAEVAGLRSEGLAGTEAAAEQLEGLCQSVDRLAAELAGIKLAQAQQQEAAEAAAAAARAEGAAAQAAAQQQCIAAARAAVESILREHGGRVPVGLATAAETAACLASLNDIVHRHQSELGRLQEAVLAGWPAASAASANASKAAGQAEAVEALQAAVAGLQEQLAGAAAAAAVAEQQQAAQRAELGSIRSELAAAQQAAAGAASLSQHVEALQAGVAALQEDGSLSPSLAEVQQRLGCLEAAAAGQQQQRQAEQASSAAFQEGALQDMGVRLEALEAGLSSRQAQQASDLAAVQRSLEAVQAQLGSLAASSAAAAQQAQRGLPAEAQQQVDARVLRTEATVAAALEEVAAQMAALKARMERAEACTAQSAEQARAAAASVHGAVLHQQQQAQQTQQQQASRRASGGEQQASPFGSPDAVHPSTVHGPATAPSRQPSLQRSSSLPLPPSHSRSSQREAPESEVFADQPGASGPGLFSRLSRSFGSQGRRSSQGPGYLSAEASAAAAAAAGEASGEGRDEEVPLRVQYSGGLDGADQEGSQLWQQGSRDALAGPAPARLRTRTTSNGGGGSGSSTPRNGAASMGKYTPRSRQWAAAMQQEGSGGGHGSPALTPRQHLSGMSSFGELPLPMSASSCLVSPREGLEEQVARLEGELGAGGGELDEVQRAILESELARLRGRLGAGGR